MVQNYLLSSGLIVLPCPCQIMRKRVLVWVWTFLTPVFSIDGLHITALFMNSINFSNFSQKKKFEPHPHFYNPGSSVNIYFFPKWLIFRVISSFMAILSCNRYLAMQFSTDNQMWMLFHLKNNWLFTTWSKKPKFLLLWSLYTKTITPILTMTNTIEKWGIIALKWLKPWGLA